MNQILLEKLNSLFKKQTEFIDFEGSPVTFHKNVEAFKKESISTGVTDNVIIPVDYIEFLENFHGCVLFKYADVGGFEFLGIGDICVETALQKKTYEEKWSNNTTVFCRIICDGDFISFKNNMDGTYDIFDCYHDENPQSWKVISNSFNSFLERLIDEKGKRFWL